jgi:hypothetical protein
VVSAQANGDWLKPARKTFITALGLPGVHHTRHICVYAAAGAGRKQAARLAPDFITGQSLDP